MKKEENAELVVRQDAPLANLDDLFESAAGEGLEKVGSDEIVIPRLSILQATSPLASEDGYKAGDIVNTISGHNYGKSFEFYPLVFWTSRTHWVSQTLGSDIDCQARDGEHGTKRDAAHSGGNCERCPYNAWSEAGPPRCTTFKNILLVAANGIGSPMVYSAKRTAIKPTNQMLSAAVLLRRQTKNGSQPVPFYACAWKLDSERRTVEGNNFFVPKFTQGTLISDPTLFMQLRTLYTEMKASQSKLVVSQENEHDAELEESAF